MERSPAEWFVEARRWYVEQHQGCPRCRTRHCVFRSKWGSRVEYHCTECDFSTAHDGTDDGYCADCGTPAAQPGIRLLLGLT